MSHKECGKETAPKLEALSASRIFSYLDDAHGIDVSQVYVAKQLASTNSWLIQAVEQGKTYRVCTTELQTAGRGTKNRVWHAGEAGTNIYLSFSYPLKKGLTEQLSNLTLVLGIATLGALKSFGVTQPLFLKWPNDIYLVDGKLGGILVETASFGRQKQAIIGIGLNLVPPIGCESSYAYLQKYMKWSELTERNRLIGYILDQALAACSEHALYGFAPWVDIWNSLDYTAMKTICANGANGKMVGRDLGVDEQGRLLIGIDEKQVVGLVAGEVTLHHEDNG